MLIIMLQSCLKEGRVMHYDDSQSSLRSMLATGIICLVAIVIAAIIFLPRTHANENHANTRQCDLETEHNSHTKSVKAHNNSRLCKISGQNTLH